MEIVDLCVSGTGVCVCVCVCVSGTGVCVCDLSRSPLVCFWTLAPPTSYATPETYNSVLHTLSFTARKRFEVGENVWESCAALLQWQREDGVDPVAAGCSWSRGLWRKVWKSFSRRCN